MKYWLLLLYLSSQLVAGGSVQSLPHSFISHGFQYEIHVGGAAPRHSRHGVLRESLNSILHTQLSSCLTYLGLLDPPAEAHAGEETGHQVAVPAIRPRAQAVDRGSLPCQEDSQDDGPGEARTMAGYSYNKLSFPKSPILSYWRRARNCPLKDKIYS